MVVQHTIHDLVKIWGVHLMFFFLDHTKHLLNVVWLKKINHYLNFCSTNSFDLHIKIILYLYQPFNDCIILTQLLLLLLYLKGTIFISIEFYLELFVVCSLNLLLIQLIHLFFVYLILLVQYMDLKVMVIHYARKYLIFELRYLFISQISLNH